MFWPAHRYAPNEAWKPDASAYYWNQEIHRPAPVQCSNLPFNPQKWPFNSSRFDSSAFYAMLRMGENAPMHRLVQLNRFVALLLIEKHGSGLAFSTHPR
jgi:hypothetical protein